MTNLLNSMFISDLLLIPFNTDLYNYYQFFDYLFVNIWSAEQFVVYFFIACAALQQAWKENQVKLFHFVRCSIRKKDSFFIFCSNIYILEFN